MKPVPVNRLVKAIVRRTLVEDIGVRGDVTTKATVPATQTCRAVIIAKSEGVIAGQAVAAEVFRQVDRRVKYEAVVPDGTELSIVDCRLSIAGQPILSSIDNSSASPRRRGSSPAGLDSRLRGKEEAEVSSDLSLTTPQRVDSRLRGNEESRDGNDSIKGVVIARISGLTSSILTAERSALNLMGRCSGIASLTWRYVRAVEGTNAHITETRKTAPGLRFLDKASVVVGGGVNHRYALYDAFLIKENHVAAAGGIAAAIRACRTLDTGRAKLRVMVEARNREEFIEALSERPDRILLDNFVPDGIRECVEFSKKANANANTSADIEESPFQTFKLSNFRTELEASGGITLDNIRSYAEAGVDFISVGALTHSVKVLDLSLLLEGVR